MIGPPFVRYREKYQNIFLLFLYQNKCKIQFGFIEIVKFTTIHLLTGLGARLEPKAVIG